MTQNITLVCSARFIRELTPELSNMSVGYDFSISNSAIEKIVNSVARQVPYVFVSVFNNKNEMDFDDPDFTLDEIKKNERTMDIDLILDDRIASPILDFLASGVHPHKILYKLLACCERARSAYKLDSVGTFK